MTIQSKLKSLTFSTTRLKVSNVEYCLKSVTSKSELLSSIVSLLTPSVVQTLPPYFHDVKTKSDADVWLTKMVSESHLFTVYLKDSESVIGFVFLSESDSYIVHLGYLLDESHWHQGYGSELLFGLIESCRSNQFIEKLIGGVDFENIASAKLLKKVGFVANQVSDNGVTFYEYTFY
jgi:ribosomal-protein-alanine N-acetyltransferase